MVEQSSYDVVVVGAGPAGSSAAIFLREKGLRVVIVEKRTFPRDKCCGDGLTTSSLRFLERLRVDPRELPSWRSIHSTVWRSPSGYTITLPVPSDGVRMGTARRDEFDHLLVRRACEVGAVVFESEEITSVDIQPDEVAIVTNKGTRLRAPYLFAADGAWSPTRKLIDGSSHARYLGNIHAFREYAQNVTGVAQHATWVSFEKDLLPGYFWAFPSGNGGANIGFGVPRVANKSMSWMKKTWQDLLQRPHIRKALGTTVTFEGSPAAWPIPAQLESSALTDSTGRVYFIGDAARAVDPLTGEGIGQAMHTSHEAVNAVFQAGSTRPMDAAKRYQKRIMRGLYIDNAFARMLSQIVTHQLGAELAIRLAPRGLQKGMYAIRWVLEDNPRAALLTPWRWNERFRHKSGVYFKSSVNNDQPAV